SSNTGYDIAHIEHMLALDSVGVDVVARDVKMTNNTGEVPQKIKDFAKKDLNNVDAVIQLNLPDNFSYKSGVQNIGCFYYETNGLPNNNWREHLEWMDKVIVSCTQQKESLS